MGGLGESVGTNSTELPLYSETTAGFYFFRQTSFEKQDLNSRHDKKLVFNTIPERMLIHQTENLFRCIHSLAYLIGVTYTQIDLFSGSEKRSPSSIKFQAAVVYFLCILPKYFMVNEGE